MPPPPHTKTRPRSLLRRLASSGLWAVIGRIASILSVLINYRMICQILSDAETSLYVVSVGVSSLGTLITGAALGQTLLRRLSPRENSDPVDRGVLLFRVFSLATVVWLILLAVLSILLSRYPNLVGKDLRPVFWFIVAWIAARCVLTLMTESFRGLQSFARAAFFGGLQEGPLVNLTVMALLAVLSSQIESARDVMTIHVCVSFAVALLASFQLRKVLGQSTRYSDEADENPNDENFDDESQRNGESRFGFEIPSYGSLIAESSKILVSQMAIFGLVEFETLLVGRYCADTQVGTWGAIRRLISLVSAPLLLINASIPSFVAELHAAGDMKRLEKLLRTAATLASPPAITALIVLWFFGEPILGIFDGSFSNGALPLALLAAANIVFVSAGSAGLTLRMTNRLGMATVTTVLAALVYIAAAPTVIDTYQLTGAAIMAATMICFRNIVATLLVRRYLQIWCVPSFNVKDAKELAVKIIRRRKSKPAS